MYCNGDCTERLQRECSVTLRRDGRSSAAVSTNSNRGHQEMAALRNALNNNVFSVVGNTASQPQSSDDSSMSPVKTPCSTSPVSSALSSSNFNKLPVKCDRYKTELCRTYEENGTCRYGDKCQFAHGAAELRTVARHPKYKTDLCRTFHTTGFCPYGSRCHFIHSLHERQLPVHSSSLQMHDASLLLPQLAAKSSPAQTNSRMITERQSVDSLLQTLSSLLQTNQLGPNDIATGLLTQQLAMKLAAHQATADFLARSVLPQALSHVSDAISVDSVSPCPSPSSLNSVRDDLFTRGSSIPIQSNAHIPQNTSFQSAFTVPSGMLTPPSSPGSAASSLNSVASDYDSYDSSRSVWPALLSPVKDVDVSLIPDFAHSRLLTSRHSVFA